MIICRYSKLRTFKLFSFFWLENDRQQFDCFHNEKITVKNEIYIDNTSLERFDFVFSLFSWLLRCKQCILPRKIRGLVTFLRFYLDEMFYEKTDRKMSKENDKIYGITIIDKINFVYCCESNNFRDSRFSQNIYSCND